MDPRDSRCWLLATSQQGHRCPRAWDAMLSSGPTSCSELQISEGAIPEFFGRKTVWQR